MMQVPAKVRYDYVYQMSCEFIVSQNITQLPADPFKIIAHNKWAVITYEQLAIRNGVTAQDIIEVLGSEDGVTRYNRRNYCIAYNSALRVFPRIKFTLFHEIGHIYLEHFLQFDVLHLPREQYEILEEEANIFAANVMAPFVVINKCELSNAQTLSCACGMSKQAAINRLKQFKSWTICEWDYKVQNVLQEYINLINVKRVSTVSLEIVADDIIA